MPTNFTLANDSLPEDLERGVSGGPGYRTIIHRQDNGVEVRIKKRDKKLGRWDIAYSLRGITDEVALASSIDDILDLFHNAYGSYATWLYKEWSDFEIGVPSNPDPVGNHRQIGTGDGSNTVFQLNKRRVLTSGAFVEIPFHRVDANSLSVYVDDALQVIVTDYTVVMTTGVITFEPGSVPANNAIVQAACSYKWLVRFEDDNLDVTVETFQVGKIEPIFIVEVLE